MRKLKRDTYYALCEVARKRADKSEGVEKECWECVSSYYFTAYLFASKGRFKRAKEEEKQAIQWIPSSSIFP